MERCYLCIDLKTFYASVECAERGLDPFLTDLVVADPSRGKGALCLAISPKMKARGIHNRCRLFEIPDDVDYICAIPRMHLYEEYSANIYSIYLKYIAKEDIQVYSIDEAFLDITGYLKLYNLEPIPFAKMILEDIYASLGLTATCGIGTNLYLSKIALDIISKHAPDFLGILDEKSYQEKIWHYKPITDLWHVGPGTAARLMKYGVDDMFGVAHMNEELLYKEFGINAEYLIDHAWGREPTTIAQIQGYRPSAHSMSNSQVLFEDYSFEDALLVVKEMVELNVLALVEKHLVTDHIFLSIGYSENKFSKNPGGRVRTTGGSMKLELRTNSYQYLLERFLAIYYKTTDRTHTIRTIALSFGNVKDEIYETCDLFTDYEALKKERNLQKALIEIKHKYGKNAVLKGMNLYEHATTAKRNTLIGGHNA